MTPEEPVNGGPSAESYARLAQAQESFKGPSAQQSVQQTLDRLRLERDATVSAGLPSRYNQQTIVGNVSGAGNRHVIEDTSSARRPINLTGGLFDDNSTGGVCNPTAPPSTGTWVWGSVNGACQWIDTTTC